MEKQDLLYQNMTAFYRGDPARIQHFVKVHSFAACIVLDEATAMLDPIGRQEGLSDALQAVLEAAALVHDIGIRPAEEKYGSCAGPLQEKEGPPLADKMLTEAGYSREAIDRVCYLVSRHHTYTGVDGPDYRILLEADFLVNCFEDKMPREAAMAALRKVFHTETGKRMMKTMFDLPDEE